MNYCKDNEQYKYVKVEDLWPGDIVYANDDLFYSSFKSKKEYQCRIMNIAKEKSFCMPEGFIKIDLKNLTTGKSFFLLMKNWSDLAFYESIL